MALGEGFEGVLAAAKTGAEWAWAQIYREYAGPVTGYLASRGAVEPEDVTSEVFLKVARSIDGFNGDESSFRSWLFVITHNRLIDDRRANGRKPTLTELPNEDWVTVEQGDVEGEAVDRLVTGELLSSFAELTDSQRQVLSLRIIAGLTLAETADVLDKRVGAVKATQRRALLALKEVMDSHRVSQ